MHAIQNLLVMHAEELNFDDVNIIGYLGGGTKTTISPNLIIIIKHIGLHAVVL